jgi:hypothetical protein
MFPRLFVQRHQGGFFRGLPAKLPLTVSFARFASTNRLWQFCAQFDARTAAGYTNVMAGAAGGSDASDGVSSNGTREQRDPQPIMDGPGRMCVFLKP